MKLDEPAKLEALEKSRPARRSLPESHEPRESREKPINYLDICAQLHAPSVSKARKGKGSSISTFNDAVVEVWEGLTPDEKQACRDIASSARNEPHSDEAKRR